MGGGAGRGSPVAKGQRAWPQMGSWAWWSLRGSGGGAAPSTEDGTQGSLAVKGLTPACIPLNPFFFLLVPLYPPLPPSSLYPKPWVFPLPPLLVTRPCFLPEIKGLSTEIPQEEGGCSLSPGPP